MSRPQAKSILLYAWKRYVHSARRETSFQSHSNVHISSRKESFHSAGEGSAVSARCLILFMSLNKPFSYMQDVWKGEMDGRPVCLKVLRIFTSRNQVEKILKVCLVSVRIKFRPTKVDNSNYAEKLLYGGNYATRTFFLFLVSIPRISCLAIALYLRGCRMEALSAS